MPLIVVLVVGIGVIGGKAGLWGWLKRMQPTPPIPSALVIAEAQLDAPVLAASGLTAADVAGLLGIAEAHPNIAAELRASRARVASARDEAVAAMTALRVAPGAQARSVCGAACRSLADAQRGRRGSIVTAQAALLSEAPVGAVGCAGVASNRQIGLEDPALRVVGLAPGAARITRLAEIRALRLARMGRAIDQTTASALSAARGTAAYVTANQGAANAASIETALSAE